MTRQEIRPVQKNDSTSSVEECGSDEQRLSSAPSSAEPPAERQASVQAETTDADKTSRVPLPSYSTLFHEGATFGQSRGSWIPEERSTVDGSQLGATPDVPQQDSERG